MKKGIIVSGFIYFCEFLLVTTYIGFNDKHVIVMDKILENGYFSISSGISLFLLFLIFLAFIFKKKNFSKKYEILLHINNLVVLFIWQIEAYAEWSQTHITKATTIDMYVTPEYIQTINTIEIFIGSCWLVFSLIEICFIIEILSRRKKTY